MRNHKRLLIVLTILVMLFTFIPLSADAAKTYTGTINANNVIMYSAASTTSKTVLTLKKGVKVEVSALTGNFYKATYNRKTGYIQKTKVSLPSASAKALAAAEVTTVKNDPKMNGITKISQIAVPKTTKKGNSGKYVLALQQALKIKGYYKPPINSKFDNATVDAVKAYQKAVKLTQTGEADYATIKKLFGKDAANATTVKTDPKMNGITKISQITVPTTTRKGNTGKNVLALQQALKIKGLYHPAINSRFDDATVAAVKAFQKASKLTQTGQADFATIKKLFGKEAANFKPTPSPTPKNR